MKLSGNILIITYWPYDSALVSTYTLPYVRMIRERVDRPKHLYLVTLSPPVSRQKPARNEMVARLRSEGIELVDLPYFPLGFRAAVNTGILVARLLALMIRRRVRNIHAWCTPAGAIGYLLSRTTGASLIIDSFEPHAESMVETGTWSRSSPAFKWLFRMERKQALHARRLICTTPEVPQYIQRAYGINRTDCLVKPACVDLELFYPSVTRQPRPAGINATDIVCVYAGKLGGIYLEGEVFDFFAVAAAFWKDRFKVLLLSGHSDEEITAMCERSGLARHLIVKLFVPHNDVPGYMALGSFGICPVKPVPTKRYCTPIKNGEYWAMGLPVVITSDISVDSDIITDNNAGYVLKSLSHDEYLAAVRHIDLLLADVSLKVRIRGLAERYRHYRIAEAVYDAIYG